MSDSPPRALALFTDRDEQRAAIHAYLDCLRAGEGHTQGALLSFHGVGGVGKTTLREKALAEFRAKLDEDVYSVAPFALAELDLDTDSVRADLPVAHLLGRVRAALRKADIQTPLFDYVYLRWWRGEYPDQSISLRKHAPGEGALAGLLDMADLVTSLASVIGFSVPSAGLAQGLHQLFPKLHDWFHESRARQRFDGSPGSWSQRERSERMPTLLALDLLEAIARMPQRSICLVVDGFERVQSRESRTDAQWALATLVAEVLRCPDTLPPPDGKPLRGRIGFMVFGREKLRWAEFYGRERVRTDWRHEITDQGELLGLTETDARWFLVEKAAAWERAQGRTAVAALIERHVDAILAAASERLCGAPPSYLPYYLDLAVLLIRDNASGFTPELLGETPAELERRFLRSLEPGHLHALQALAVALEFDRGIFDFLRAQGFLEGYDFAWLVGDHWSFVNPVADRPGFHGLHRHMQASLIASLEPAEEMARARSILAALLERLLATMHFDRPADFGPAQEKALSDAMALLREHEADGLLEGASAIARALALEARFDSVQAMSVRRPFLEWSVQTALRVLGPDHPDTLTTHANLASFTGKVGDPAAARELFRALLPDLVRVLGPEHPDTLTTRNNIAAWTGEAGEPAAARDLFLALLPDQVRVLGPEHPDTLRTRNNIAALTGEAGEPAAARDLFRALLPDQVRVLGPEHPATLTTRNNLAHLTGEAGDAAAARDLFRALLPDQMRVLGPEHPETLRTRNNIAAWTGEAGDAVGARDLFLALLPDQVRVLGPDHPHTVATRGWIEHLDKRIGRPSGAADHAGTHAARLRRNSACPCGSGLRTKHCHGKPS